MAWLDKISEKCSIYEQEKIVVAYWVWQYWWTSKMWGWWWCVGREVPAHFYCGRVSETETWRDLCKERKPENGYKWGADESKCQGPEPNCVTHKISYSCDAVPWCCCGSKPINRAIHDFTVAFNFTLFYFVAALSWVYTKLTQVLSNLYFQECLIALVASVFMGFGILFLLLWVGIYVWETKGLLPEMCDWSVQGKTKCRKWDVLVHITTNDNVS